MSLPRAPNVVRAPLRTSLVLLLGCASRDVPAHYPESSPASPEATPAPALQVTHALAGDPPLPGEQGAGWRGLGEGPASDAGAVDPHAHHRGHHHAH